MDRAVKILCITEWICVIIIVLLFFIHMYFNWLYKGPWDDSNFSIVSNIMIAMVFIFSLITESLNYEVKK